MTTVVTLHGVYNRRQRTLVYRQYQSGGCTSDIAAAAAAAEDAASYLSLFHSLPSVSGDAETAAVSGRDNRQ
jgi:hypothetical protein